MSPSRLHGRGPWLACLVAALAVWFAPAGADAPGDTARLPGPAYPLVTKLADAGRPADALAELGREAGGRPADRPVEAEVLRAALLERAGRHAESAAAWDGVAAREAALATLARRRAAEALIAAGDPDGAVERLGQPARSGSARANDDLLLEAAVAYRKGGKPDRGADLARRIADIERRGPLADRARLELAAALEASKQPVGAIAVLREAQREFRTAAAYDEAREAERRLTKTLGVAPAPFSERDYRTIAGRLSTVARFPEALEALREWRRTYPQSASADRIDADIVDDLYRMRANDEARSAAGAFLKQHAPGARAALVRVLLFRLDVREGRTADVKSRGLAIWRGGVPGLASGDRHSVGSLLAAYLVSVGDLDGGLAIYRELFRQTRSRGAQTEVLWRAGLAAYRAGQYTRAESNLRAALARRPGSNTADLVSYWLAATEVALGRRQDAVARLSALVGAGPWSYYGLRAAERLRAMGETPPAAVPVAFPDLAFDASTLKRPEHRAATLLARAGLAREAAAAARDLARAARGDRAATLLAVRASEQAGDYRDALSLVGTYFGRYLEGPATGMPDDFLSLVYPRAFLSEVGPVAAAQRVDPLLMLALMRRESRFDPNARSAAGATGLFQIMSYTADKLAPEAGIADPDEDLLTEPPANATIAAALVRKLLDLFGGHAAPVMAAFNAGEDRTGAWWKAAHGITEDLFVDTMPYSETRTYVREVWVNYEMYRRIYR